jgi:hypothetical protein
MDNVIYIIRGLSGAGKSTTSRRLELPTSAQVEADQYFERGGSYEFDPRELKKAHAWAQRKVMTLVKKGTPEIAVSNTFTQAWEAEGYLSYAVRSGYEVVVIDIYDGGKSDKELFKRNVHGVPLVAIQGMRKRYEPVNRFVSKLRSMYPDAVIRLLYRASRQ